MRRGFSLVEALVALALLATLLTLALPLVLESLRLLNETGRRAGAAERDLALVRLRVDLEAATGVLGPRDFAWREGSLRFTRPGESVAWTLVDGTVVRSAWRAGSAVAERTEMRGVTQWRWRALDDRVDVEILRDGHRQALAHVVADRRGAAAPLHDLLVVRLGGAPQRGRW